MKRKYVNENFPHLIHGADYNPEQWIYDKNIWNEDMALMKKANCNEMTVGIFSWSMMEAKEGEFDFSFLDEIIEKVGNNGGKIILATPSGARPHWLSDKYQEVLRVTSRRERMSFSRRHNHCYTSPIYREKVKIINKKLAERYGNNPTVVAWHISNEYGGECYCPLCQQAFRDFLKEKYKTIENLNKVYWTGYWSKHIDSFEQIEAPSPLTDCSLTGLNLDWKRFVSHQTLDFMKAEINAIREGGSTLPVTTNMMPGFYMLDYFKFAKYLDVISCDSYPDWHAPNSKDVPMEVAFWHDFFRTLKNRPFLLMESAPGLVNWKPYNKLKRPGVDMIDSLQAVAHGSDSVQYFQWRKGRGGLEKFHGAVVDHRGTDETRIFRNVQTTGNILKNIDEVAGSVVESKVAIIYDWENKWALQEENSFQNRDKKYNQTCFKYYRPLWEKGVSVDVINTDGDFSKYDLIIAPMLYMTSDKTIEKIEDYVKNGGTFYATYTLGMVDENDLVHLGGFPSKKLKDVFGIWNEEIDSLYPEEKGEIEFNKNKYVQIDYAERIHLQGAKALAKYTKDFYAEESCFTVNQYGKGKAYYQAFRDDGKFSYDIISNIVDELKIKGAIPFGKDSLMSAHIRKFEDNTYLFVENYSNKVIENVGLGDKYTYLDRNCTDIVDEISLPPYSITVLKKFKDK